MKKILLITLNFLSAFILIANNPVNIYKRNLSVMNFNSSDIDSLKFSADKTTMNIYKSDVTVESVFISEIDSVNFDVNAIQNQPVLAELAFDNILNNSAQATFLVKSTGGTSIIEKGICWNTTENPTIENNKLISASFVAHSDENLSGLTSGTTYYARAYAKNAAGVSYSNQVSFTTTNYALPTVETVSASYNYSTNKATCVVKVANNGGCNLIERGICWSTSRNPTIANNKYSSGTSTGQFYAMMSDLNLNATYYVRSFATNCLGTAYGNEIKVQALMGNVTYTLAVDSAANPTYYNLIKIAMDSACYYYNRYTNFRGNVYVYYNAGIPTAQASYHGSIGFGPNTRYMWVGTALHEMAHFVGSGTTSQWQTLIVNNVWKGSVASALLYTATGETLKGDSQHFWPYGINQKEEITSLGGTTAQQNGLILTAKLVKAMCVDDAKLPTSW